ncbi:helix-turn-helix domain-containing protein [Streptomyces bobili]|uniref:helix-turn-helix domain-containing protein n=1 Tax=Streptomyces TaxID=1883 RepID=UPI002251A4B1|nr:MULTISPECIES: helix-turn-helix transcriptional regulator [Streptomyces]MCX5525515.1 helix-turn-helix domain-containing protein [Streptomyces bobili]MDX3572746.1 helix-turn-helix transcriptional regulator [Streptomyces sp. ID05-47C]
MPIRKPPTARQRRLGAELRRMREQVGLSLTEAAALHRVDKTAISNTEAARFGVSADRVRVWAVNYACPEQAYVDALADMARERAGAHWWDAYRDSMASFMLDLVELEHHAVSLRHVQITHLPGLLQHEDYARAVFGEAVPPLEPQALDRQVEFRMRRRALLDRPEPPDCSFLLHEAALRMLFGDRAVVRRQLEELLKQSERESVTLRVIPFASGGFPSAGSSTMYASGPVRQLDTVQIDVPNGVTFLDSETHLTNYRAVLDRMEQRSLEPGHSRDFIRKVLHEL